MTLVCPEIIPNGTGRKIYLRLMRLGEIGLHVALHFLSVTVPPVVLIDIHRHLRSIVSLQHRCHEDGAAEHILVVHVPHIAVTGKIHHQSAHEAASAVAYVPRSGIYIRQKRVAQTYGILDSVIHRLSFLAELVYLPRSIGTVGTHHRIERAKLQPTHIQFPEHRIARRLAVGIALVVMAAEETANITVVVRIAGEREVKAGRNLLAQCLPRRAYIARPDIGTVTLLSGKAAAGEYHHTLV